jgi:hypothetical protein
LSSIKKIAIIKMSSVYFFNNETKNEFVYVNNYGTYSMDMDKIAEYICNTKKWEVTDKVVIIPLNDKRIVSYCYQNKKFQIEYTLYKDNPNWIEIETNEDEVFNSEEVDYEDYDSDYNYEDIEDDRYDDRDDYDEGNGYEDESYECCDIY